jgi:excisionase family DNA binding protein
MDDPAFWRDLQAQFRSLLAFSITDLSALLGPGDVVVLSGGPRDDDALRVSLETQFRALAIRGGIATGASKERALQAWLELLRQRSPWFREVTGSSVVNEFTDPLDLPVNRIDLPAEEDRVSEEDRDWPVITVDRQPNDRYIVIAGHRDFQSEVKEGVESVRGRIRTSSAERIDLESGWIDHICRASAELCTVLETEAFARQHETGTQSSPNPPLSKQQAARRSNRAHQAPQSQSPAIESVLSVQRAAKLLGVHEDTVRRMQDSGKIRLVRVGNRRRVRKSDIERLLRTEDYPKRRVRE